jgi:hypothetical protein
MKRSLLLGSVLVLASGYALAADSPWVGTWKLDESKSQLTGDTFTYSQGPGRMLHFSDGVNASYDFSLDGKEHPGAYGRAVSWTAAGPNTWDTVTKSEGRVLGTSRRQLSADGKTLTMTFSGKNPDGSAYNEEDVYERVSGTDGLIGTWRSVKIKNPGGPRVFVISNPRPGVLHYDLPELKASVEGPADGKDLPISGPDLPPHMTYAYTIANPRTVHYTLKIDGKVESQGVQTLAADGRSYTDVSSSPGKEGEKTTGFWIKQ